jgi:DNA-directed RNA polymerase alpha subunit
MANPEGGYQPSEDEVRAAESSMDERMHELSAARESTIAHIGYVSDEGMPTEDTEGQAFAEEWDNIDSARKEELFSTKAYKKMSIELTGEGLPKSDVTFMTRQLMLDGYKKIDELSALTRDEVMRLPGVGKKSIRVIEIALTKKGLRFKDYS